MDPAIETGDVIVTEPIAPTEAEVGDVVTFRDPEGSDALITHRARLVRAKGDRSPSSPAATPTTTSSAGASPPTARSARVGYRIPKLGSVLNRFGDGPARGILIAAPALLLLVLGLLRIWRPDEKPEEDPA